MRLPIRILLITMLFMPTLLIAQESNPEKPLENSEPSAASNEEPSATTNKETQDDRDFKPSEEISEDFPVPLPSDI